MIYHEFQGDTLSALGFGAMRLPTLADESIDVARVEEMVAYAMAHGVNYFDTAMPYHAGMSEVVMGKILSKYPRDSYRLATKYPGHQVCSSYDPAATFEQQLRKCGVEYFDYYLLHNVSESTVGNYEDPRWGIIPYFLEQKRLGRIKHLGFSTHGRLGMLRGFLERHGKDMDFCQIQLNYLDWTLQYAKEKYAMLEEFGIPVWVMEPVRGGKLAKLDPESEARMKQLRPEESVAAWGFRFLQGLPNVKMILSGMSNMDQMVDNVKTFTESKPLNGQEQALVFEIAEGLKNTVPCTRCRYCCDGCPKGLDIPTLLGILNELRFSDSVNTAMMLEFAPEDQKPTACIACGKCVRSCPQNIDIPGALKELTEKLKTIPSWAALSKLREEEMRQSMASLK
ncbi:MAG: aldo/keto reductase [Oscillospiraceae bacterium]|nr:aldo/keto reductase [Oscillospiraceae bacterium]